MQNDWLTSVLISLVLTHLIFSVYKYISTRIQLKRSKDKYEGILRIKYKNKGAIHAKLYYNSENKIYGFEVNGHSEHDEYGNDIFAAAVSVIAQNTLNALHLLTEEKLDYYYTSGYLKCFADGLRAHNDESNARAILKTAELAFYTLSDGYGEGYLSIETIVK